MRKDKIENKKWEIPVQKIREKRIKGQRSKVRMYVLVTPIALFGCLLVV